MALEVSIKKKFKGFSLEVDFDTDKDCMGILGASGCGKSMTLKCIAGIEKPDLGRIALNGKILFDSEKRINVSPQKRRVGYLFQNYALFPTMTVEENIICAIPKHKASEKKAIVMEKLSQFQLEDLGKRYPSQLSGGQQQRVALARMLAYEPEMIMLDEPFSALDSFLKDILQQQLIETINEFGGETVIVSHSRDEIYKLCEKLAIMSEGQMILKGNTKEIFASPGKSEAAKLTGCKNISPIEKIESHRLYAKDWKVTLKTNRPISDNIRYVGIRAHDIKPVQNGNGENTMEVKYVSSSQGPFEMNYLLQNAGDEKTENLWLMEFKESGLVPLETKNLRYVSLPADKLMFLE